MCCVKNQKPASNQRSNLRTYTEPSASKKEFEPYPNQSAFEPFKNPCELCDSTAHERRRIPCGHMICIKDLKVLYDSASEDSTNIECPVCKKPIPPKMFGKLN